MRWILILPVFRRLFEIVDQETLYLALMNGFVLLSLFWTLMLYFTKSIKIDTETFQKRLRVNLIVISAALVLFIWLFFFSNFLFYIRDNQPSATMMAIARSPYCFAFFYCGCAPLLFGIAISVLIKIIRFMARERKS